MIRKGLNSNLKGSNSRTLKLQNYDRKAKQIQLKSEQLQKENNEMEQRIASLKSMMQKEREERERLGGYRWKSSKDPSSDSKPAMAKGEKRNSKPKPKFKILSDKPLEKYTKKTKVEIELAKDSSICGQCENVRAKLDCTECGESYCPPCYKQFHAKGAMRKHTWKTIDQERLSASKKTSQPEFESKSSAGSSPSKSEVLTDAVSDSGPNGSQSGGLLLMGTYDESESAQSFQNALREWRNEPAVIPKQKKDLWVNPTNEQSLKETRTCATEAGPNVDPRDLKSPSDLKLNFKPTMSYADRLALKKHRKDPSSKNGFVKPENSKHEDPKHLTSTSMASTVSRARDIRSNTFSGTAPSQESRPIDHPRSISIQLLPSDEEENKYPYCEEGSPIVNEAIIESPRSRTDRRTLSQMGRLKIVELSFSDPENDSKTDGARVGSAASAASLVSVRRVTSGSQSQLVETSSPKQGLIPHPPSTPSSTYVARQKILLNKNKKTLREETGTSMLNKLIKNENKRWKPPKKYIGLDSFFMAGVEKENKENITEKHTAVTDDIAASEVLKNLPDATNCPVITVGFENCWRPDSSWSYAPDSVHGDVLQSSKKENREFQSEQDSHQAKPIQPSKITDKLTQQSTNKYISVGDNVTPRVSMTEFDFLSAMPPMSKGDDFNKIHRASTVTLFALSPQPPDIWNDDSSEFELLNSPKVSKSPKNKVVLNESDEDERALEALSNEIANSNKALEGKAEDTGEREAGWEEDSLSIEDNDDGSGLTSSGDADTHYDGDDSSDNEYYDSKNQVENLH